VETAVTTRRSLMLGNRSRNQRGFTLIEVLVSIFVLMIGLVSLLGVFGIAIGTTQTAQEDMIAKQLAQEAMESIYTARETANIQWVQIQNVGTGQIPDGIFVTGLQPIKQSGADGICGTADDAAALPETLTLPGADGIVGTPDDVNQSLANFRRSIAITAVISNGGTVFDLRTITITIQYTTPQRTVPKTYVLSGFISQYR
jgi:prepilin-type N-terminal cleavage/methylation domain-containing protein